MKKGALDKSFVPLLENIENKPYLKYGLIVFLSIFIAALCFYLFKNLVGLPEVYFQKSGKAGRTELGPSPLPSRKAECQLLNDLSKKTKNLANLLNCNLGSLPETENLSSQCQAVLAIMRLVDGLISTHCFVKPSLEPRPTIIPSPLPCREEGEIFGVGIREMGAPEERCCPGLEAIAGAIEEDGVCLLTVEGQVCVIKCGDGQCTKGENRCNCPQDCPEY